MSDYSSQFPPPPGGSPAPPPDTGYRQRARIGVAVAAVVLLAGIGVGVAAASVNAQSEAASPTIPSSPETTEGTGTTTAPPTPPSTAEPSTTTPPIQGGNAGDPGHWTGVETTAAFEQCTSSGSNSEAFCQCAVKYVASQVSYKQYLQDFKANDLPDSLSKGITSNCGSL